MIEEKLLKIIYLKEISYFLSFYKDFEIGGFFNFFCYINCFTILKNQNTQILVRFLSTNKFIQK